MISIPGSKHNKSKGQALVEFALIISVLLMMIFLIIESGRILWAWNTVQHAAREGARYAITGESEGPNCPVGFGLDKFVQSNGGRNVCELTDERPNYRLASIIARVHSQLNSLPLNESSTTFEDDYYYNIEVWGVDDSAQLQYDNPGRPGLPVVVRVTYQVSIITPFFRPIRTTIPVFGQETLNNEPFGQQSVSTTGNALPPPVPPLPTPGVTPSPIPPTDTPTPGPSNTPSPTPTNTPLPRCDVQFEGYPIAGDNFVNITGDIGTTVTIIDLTTGRTLGSAQLLDRDGHACDGFATISLNETLQEAHLLLAESSDTSTDTAIVLALPPTNTPTATFTPVPTNTPTSTPTTTPTYTPSNPYIILLPSCGTGPNVQFTVLGFNWDTNEGIVLQWDGINQLLIQPNTHNGTFSYTWSFSGVSDGQHEVRAYSTGTGAQFDEDIKYFEVPCSNIPTNTPEPSVTPTLSPADLVIYSPPQLISTPPIVAYEPVAFSVVITNIGQTDVNSQFFVDVYLDPTNVYTDNISLNESGGYVAVSSLPGSASRVLTITVPLGFSNSPANHQVYGMVDSVRQINEGIETNNISTPLAVNFVTPAAATPTPTATPGGSDTLAGVVQVLTGELLPQFRAFVTVRDPGLPGSGIVDVARTDFNGFYQFANIPPPVNPGGYIVTACMQIDDTFYFGSRTGIMPPNNVVNIYMLSGPCS